MTDQPTTYARLSAPFDVEFTDNRGGVELTYITGEQVISRLNEVLGVAGWSFKVLAHDLDKEADEAWVLGQLEAKIDGEVVIKEQFGSQKVKRSRNTGTPLDLGFDLKGATTDAMKKCASLLGVGLYLSVKKPQPQRQQRPQNQPARPANPANGQVQETHCSGCNAVLREFDDTKGKHWTVQMLADYGRNSKHKRILCVECLTKANEAVTA